MQFKKLFKDKYAIIIFTLSLLIGALNFESFAFFYISKDGQTENRIIKNSNYLPFSSSHIIAIPDSKKILNSHLFDIMENESFCTSVAPLYDMLSGPPVPETLRRMAILQTRPQL